MAIQINGDGTITGISVGGLPDGIVDTDMIANSAVTPAKSTISGGKIKQFVHTIPTTEVQSTTNSFSDITGFSLAITPTSASNLLLCQIHISGCALYDTSGSDHHAEFSLTDDGGSTELASERFRLYEYGSGYHLGLYENTTYSMSHIKTAGSTSARTYQLRFKLIQGEKITVNNDGDSKSIISITEIAP